MDAFESVWVFIIAIYGETWSKVDLCAPSWVKIETGDTATQPC